MSCLAAAAVFDSRNSSTRVSVLTGCGSEQLFEFLLVLKFSIFEFQKSAAVTVVFGAIIGYFSGCNVSSYTLELCPISSEVQI